MIYGGKSLSVSSWCYMAKGSLDLTLWQPGDEEIVFINYELEPLFDEKKDDGAKLDESDASLSAVAQIGFFKAEDVKTSRDNKFFYKAVNQELHNLRLIRQQTSHLKNPKRQSAAKAAAISGERSPLVTLGSVAA